MEPGGPTEQRGYPRPSEAIVDLIRQLGHPVGRERKLAFEELCSHPDSRKPHPDGPEYEHLPWFWALLLGICRRPWEQVRSKPKKAEDYAEVRDLAVALAEKFYARVVDGERQHRPDEGLKFTRRVDPVPGLIDYLKRAARNLANDSLQTTLDHLVGSAIGGLGKGASSKFLRNLLGAAAPLSAAELIELLGVIEANHGWYARDSTPAERQRWMERVAAEADMERLVVRRVLAVLEMEVAPREESLESGSPASGGRLEEGSRPREERIGSGHGQTSTDDVEELRAKMDAFERWATCLEAKADSLPKPRGEHGQLLRYHAELARREARLVWGQAEPGSPESIGGPAPLAAAPLGSGLGGVGGRSKGYDVEIDYNDLRQWLREQRQQYPDAWITENQNTLYKAVNRMKQFIELDDELKECYRTHMAGVYD